MIHIIASLLHVDCLIFVFLTSSSFKTFFSLSPFCLTSLGLRVCSNVLVTELFLQLKLGPGHIE